MHFYSKLFSLLIIHIVLFDSNERSCMCKHVNPPVSGYICIIYLLFCLCWRMLNSLFN